VGIILALCPADGRIARSDPPASPLIGVLHVAEPVIRLPRTRAAKHALRPAHISRVTARDS